MLSHLERAKTLCFTLVAEGLVSCAPHAKGVFINRVHAVMIDACNAEEEKRREVESALKRSLATIHALQVLAVARYQAAGIAPIDHPPMFWVLVEQQVAMGEALSVLLDQVRGSTARDLEQVLARANNELSIFLPGRPVPGNAGTGNAASTVAENATVQPATPPQVKCWNCGRDTRADSDHCLHCGRCIGESEDASSPTQPAECGCRKALKRVMVAGNHIASTLIGWQIKGQEFPPYTATVEDGRRAFKDVDKYDVWVCWKTIMEIRDEKIECPCDSPRAEVKRLKAEAFIFQAENQRLFDLVRFARHHLHNENAISDKEFAALVMDDESGQRVMRLETYDQLRAELATRDKRISELEELARNVAWSNTLEGAIKYRDVAASLLSPAKEGE